MVCEPFAVNVFAKLWFSEFAHQIRSWIVMHKSARKQKFRTPGPIAIRSEGLRADIHRSDISLDCSARLRSETKWPNTIRSSSLRLDMQRLTSCSVHRTCVF